MEKFDSIILGGGVSGVGAAIAAGRRGLRCLVLERDEFCGATSANSLRIIHGGLRYLQSLSLARAVGSIRAQAEIFRSYGDFVKPLPCIMPLDRLGLKSRLPVMLGTLLYRTLGLSSGVSVPEARVVGGAEAESLAPALSGRMRHGALLWHDGIISDLPGISDRLHAEALSAGAVMMRGVTVADISSRKGFVVKSVDGQSWASDSVIDARGPWVGINAELGWCLGFNLVLNRPLCKEAAISVRSPSGRLFFAAPRGGQSVLGTEYLPVPPPSPGSTSFNPSEESIQKFIDEFNQALPEAGLTLGDVASVDAGVLPRSPRRGDVEPLGSERVLNRSGLITLISTKYTTFLNLGRRAAGQALRYSRPG